MKKSKKKRIQAQSEPEKAPISTIEPPQEADSASADSPMARQAGITEDAARAGDAGALEPDIGEEEAATEPDAEDEANEPDTEANEAEAENAVPDAGEENAEAADAAPEPKTPSRRAQRRQRRQAAYARTDAFLGRERDLNGRDAARLARERRLAARELGTPRRYDTGLPRRRHPLRATLAVLFSLGVMAFVGAYFAFDVPNCNSWIFPKSPPRRKPD